MGQTIKSRKCEPGETGGNIKSQSGRSVMSLQGRRCAMPSSQGGRMGIASEIPGGLPEAILGMTLALARAVLCLLAFTCTAVFAAGSAPLPRVPILQNVGVIPVQIEGNEAALGGSRPTLQRSLSKAVRASQRFRVLSDDLVEGAWNTVTGRSELRSQFELHAYTSLQIVARGDTITLTTRLLDPNLKTLLQENETVSADGLQLQTPGETYRLVEDLVFRLINRIPVDVSVTSVQGAYITLSGGADQGVEVGDKVDIVRARVKSLHPANGTWLDFQRQALGSARVVESKKATSVAKVIDQTYDNAIQVGDGARIPALTSRVRFARLTAEQSSPVGDPESIIVNPLSEAPAPENTLKADKTNTAQASPKTKEPSTESVPSKPETPPAEEKPAGERKEASASPPPAENAENNPKDSSPGLWDNVTEDVTSHKLIDEINAYAGPSWWSMTLPPYNTSGKFPVWLVNSFGGGITRTMLFKFKTAFGGGLSFGNTQKSSYFGYDTYAKIYWEDNFASGGEILQAWRAGGAGTFSGISVSQGKYGGGDWLRMGIFGGLSGSIRVGAEHDRYDWFSDIALMPLTIGRIGYAGSRHQIDSTNGMRVTLGAFRYEPPRVIQWGGSFEYGDERETLTNGRRPHITDYSLRVLAKYVL